MQSQNRDLFRNVYFHFIISNYIFKWNIRGPENDPFLESMLHLFVRPFHMQNNETQDKVSTILRYSSDGPGEL